MTFENLTKQSLMSESAEIVGRLESDPIFRNLSGATIARLLASLNVIEVKSDTLLYKCGEQASHLYLLLAGKMHAETKDGVSLKIIDSRGGDEVLCGLPIYTNNLSTLEKSKLIKIDKKILDQIIVNNPDIRTEALRLLSQRFAQEDLAENHQQLSPDKVIKKAKLYQWKNIKGWLATSISPLVLIYLFSETSLQYNLIIFFAALLATSCMWLFSLVDEYIPPIFLMIVSLAYNIVPPEVAFKGFGSEALFLFLGVYALAIVIEDSGIAYRFMLWLLNHLPSRFFWQRAILLITGYILSPVMSSGNSRVAIVQPLYREMIQCLGVSKRSPSATILATTSFSGAMLMSPMFITSKPSNLLVIETLPEDIKSHFTQILWVKGALIAMITVTAGHFIADRLIYGRLPNLTIPKQLMKTQLGLLGPLSIMELVSIFSLVFFIGSAITTSWHNVPLSTVSGVLLLALLMCGFITKKKFQQNIDWSMILFLLSLDSIIAIMRHLDVTSNLTESIKDYIFEYLPISPYIFILFEFLLVGCIRIALPITAGMIVSVLLLMPLSPIVGINPWIIGFLAGLFSDAWFLAYQSSQYIQFRNKEGGANGSYDEALFLKHNNILSITRLVAAFISLPYWRWLGILDKT